MQNPAVPVCQYGRFQSVHGYHMNQSAIMTLRFFIHLKLYSSILKKFFNLEDVFLVEPLLFK